MKQKAEKVQKVKAPKRRRPMSLERKTKWAGIIFLIPWMLGTLYFFIVPFISAIRYSFSNVILRGDGLHITFNGVENYKYIFFTDATYLPNVTSSLQDLVTSVPIIVVFSHVRCHYPESKVPWPDAGACALLPSGDRGFQYDYFHSEQRRVSFDHD